MRGGHGVFGLLMFSSAICSSSLALSSSTNSSSLVVESFFFTSALSLSLAGSSTAHVLLAGCITPGMVVLSQLSPLTPARLAGKLGRNESALLSFSMDGAYEELVEPSESLEASLRDGCEAELSESSLPCEVLSSLAGYRVSRLFPAVLVNLSPILALALGRWARAWTRCLTAAGMGSLV